MTSYKSFKRADENCEEQKTSNSQRSDLRTNFVLDNVYPEHLRRSTCDSSKKILQKQTNPMPRKS